MLIAVGETAWLLKVLASWGIWPRISSVVIAPVALMVLASTDTRLVPTGAMPRIEVPVAVTVTCSTSSCACAWPGMTAASAPRDAPHRSLLTKRTSTLDSKNIGALQLLFLGPVIACSGCVIVIDGDGGAETCQEMHEIASHNVTVTLAVLQRTSPVRRPARMLLREMRTQPASRREWRTRTRYAESPGLDQHASWG